MREDIQTFIKDKNNGVYIQDKMLEKDANRNIKTFLITISVRDAMIASTKDKEVKKLIEEIKMLIKEFRNAKVEHISESVTFVESAPKEEIIEKVMPVVEVPQVEEQTLEEESKPEVVEIPQVEEPTLVEESKSEVVEVPQAEEQTLDAKSMKPLVYHKEHKQLSFIIDGNGYVQVGDDVYSVERGSLVLFEENTMHSFLCIKGTMTLLHLHTPKIYGDEDWYMVQEISEKWRTFL
jgi:quercetin dioxygenase-like cupin family protein